MKRLLAGGAALMLLAPPVAAHHSGAMFDTAHTVTLTGVVRQFQYTNPHCYIQIEVEGGSSAREWSVEMAAPSHLQRMGWRKATLKPGDRIKVTIAPLRNGDPGGEVREVTKADGSPLDLVH